MKLIIQILCYNEEKTLPQVIEDLPRELPGIDSIEYLVVDDGSTDRTVETAREVGAHHVTSLKSNQGCGAAFQHGLQECIELGADIIVNTDGDNQYKGSCVESIVTPILEGTADIVIGTRPIEEIEEFSWLKKKLQRIGSYVARRFSGEEVPDATSGFRAFSADAAMHLHITTRYSHTLETIIQSGRLNMEIEQVPIEVNAKTRESRLMTSISQYIWRSAFIILRSYIRYSPRQTFLFLSSIFGIPGLLICLRFLYYSFILDKSGYIQSLILAAVLLLMSFQLLVLGIIADLVGLNRRLLQENYYLNKRQVREKHHQ
ncbi:MAG: glycosyltransferase family 2 protein [Deltaproteobacteria bacterium]|nr:glycosyltransferase family 2 protein [Deltaproteobacteria bacterium]MBN2846653.1 glycosyltransferase family 2 protein [Deltaproteobacteria bacterium]